MSNPLTPMFLGRGELYGEPKMAGSPHPLRRSIMNALFPDTEKYARCIRASNAVRWDIDNDVIKGRSFDRAKKYLPDGLSLVQELPTLSDAERRFASQVQGRTYANVFGLVERFITAKLLEVGREHSLGDQNALEALV